MWRDEPLKGRVNYAVVVKAKKITGAASGIMHEVLMQVKQCLGGLYIDKRTSEEQMVHVCFVVSSREIKKEGVNSFHNLLQQENLMARVFTIDGDDLWKLVQGHLPQHTVHAKLNSAYEALGSPHPDYEFSVLLKGKERRFELVPKHQNAQPFPFPEPIFPETQEGEQKKEEFQKWIEDGANVDLTHENIPFEKLPEPLRVLFPFAQDSPYTICVGPSRLEHPLRVSITVEGDGGLSLTLPTIEFTEVHGGVDSTTATNEDQQIPLRVFLKISDRDHSVGFHYTFHLAGNSVYWLVQASRVQDIMSGGARVVMRDLGTGVIIASFRISPRQVRSWGEPFSIVASEILGVQDMVKTAIVIPERSYFTRRDIMQVALIRRILDTGKHPCRTENVRVTFVNDPSAAKTLLEEFEKERGPDVRFGYEECFEELLDQNISLGPMEAHIPAARLSSEDLEKLRRCAAGKSRCKDFELRVLPGEGQAIEVTFPKWQKRTDAEPIAHIKESHRRATRSSRKSPRPKRKN